MNRQITNKIKKLGWAEIKLSNESITKLNELIFFSESIYQIKKNDNYNIDSLENDIREASTKTILRYSDQSKIFVKSLIKDLVKYNPYIKDFYLTPPYIITHLPKELLEKGDYHSDKLKYCGKLYTSWTPINNYQMDYPALSIINKSHSYYLKIIFKLLNKIRLSNNFNKVLKILLIKPLDLIVKKNFTYLWIGDLIHKGNCNKTNKKHSALVVRISEKPLYYEPTVKISDILNNSDFTNNLKKISVDDLSSTISKVCNVAKNKSDLIEYACNLKDTLDKNILKHVSFSLSLLAQKFENRFHSNLDLISFILAKENLVSLERYLTKFKDEDISKKIINRFFVDTNLSYQESLIIKKFKNQNFNDINHQKKIEWLE